MSGRNESASPCPLLPEEQPVSKEALRKRKSRENESKQRRSKRLKEQSERQARLRANESDVDRNHRLTIQSVRQSTSRLNESDVDRNHRLIVQSVRQSTSRANESDLERNRRLSSQASRQSTSRANESDQERNRRLSSQASRQSTSRANESDPDRNHRLSGQALRQSSGRANESAEESAIRLASQALRQSRLREEESAEARRERLSNQNQRQVQRRATNYNSGSSKYALSTLDDFEEEDIIESSIGEMRETCEYCQAKFFPSERPKSDKRFTVCCSKGAVKLPAIDFNDYLQTLMSGEDADSNLFMENIRSYNSFFSFVSVGANVSFPPGLGPYCFRIHGQMYHRSGPLHPEDEEARKFGQLYILDEAAAVERRLEEPANEKCKLHIMERLADMMKSNPFARAYKMMHEVEKEQDNSEDTHRITMAILQNRSSDPRLYNPQRCNEVAVVFSSSDGEPPVERDLVVYLKASDSTFNLQRVSHLNKNLDAMCYPLLFPHGEQSWGEDVMLYNPRGTGANARKRVTLKMFYSYYLQIRNGFNQFLRAGRLTQQYIVNAYVKAEANDLNYIRQHQKELRCDNYTNLQEDNLGENGGIPGKRIILPSSFTGSPRNMQQNYQDAMAIVRKFGKPDLFITMTCNPKWKEITDNLASNERPENRPDLVNRVFKLKLSQLLEDITRRGIFGRVLAKVHVIEFQKRGLPHAHILIFLHPESKPTAITLIDQIVSAEIPNPVTQSRLFSIVTSNMLHGPCGACNPAAPCMKNGKCSKKFPKAFQAETNPNVNGYPIYRRRQSTSIKVGKRTVDNTWVIPYNPFLSLKYNCHVNVEVCASFKSVKYLFKYAFKGTDCANIEIKVDEVTTHVDSRYVSPPEAMWRIYRFPMHHQSHAVIRLMIHLENDPLVVFNPSQLSQALQAAETKDTTLTAWFKLNQRDKEAHQYRYYEIPEHYVFNRQDKCWTARKSGHGKVIGRMHYVSPKDKERYFLRLILLHVAGARSFQELRIVDGRVCGSFYEAAGKLGLVSDDQVWSETLEEASSMAMPNKIRDLFAYMCVYSDMTDASPLWTKYKKYMIEDYSFAHRHNSEDECELCCAFALRDIEAVLLINDKRCTDYMLKSPGRIPSVNIIDCVALDQEKRSSIELISSLSAEQADVFQTIRSAMDSTARRNNCFFLDGPGGSGKTYLYRTLLSYVRGNGKIALPVASTGIAANLLKGGRTYHSQFKIPLKLSETSVSSVKPNSNAASHIRDAKLIIWDESTMALGLALECIDRLLKELMRNTLPFGGKVLLMGGDFRQCLPVIPGADHSEIAQSCVKNSPLWKEFKMLRLNCNRRCTDPDYSSWLLQLGNGTLTNSHGLGDDIIEIPQSMLTTTSLVEEIFGMSISKETVESNLLNVAILCPRNEEVDFVNKQVMSNLNTEEKSYLSSDSLVSDDNDDVEDYPIEFLNKLHPAGTAPHELKLKVGSIVMLLRNLNTKRGLCNGTRLIVQELKRNLIIATVITGSSIGETVFIPRIDIITDSDIPFQLKRRQFPLKLAFAMTINKSQGQTLDKIGIYLHNPVFGHGQLYVAFSRVRRSEDVKVFIRETEDQGKLLQDSDRVFTKNVVYKSVLE